MSRTDKYIYVIDNYDNKTLFPTNNEVFHHGTNNFAYRLI